MPCRASSRRCWWSCRASRRPPAWQFGVTIGNVAWPTLAPAARDATHADHRAVDRVPAHRSDSGAQVGARAGLVRALGAGIIRGAGRRAATGAPRGAARGGRLGSGRLLPVRRSARDRPDARGAPRGAGSRAIRAAHCPGPRHAGARGVGDDEVVRHELPLRRPGGGSSAARADSPALAQATPRRRHYLASARAVQLRPLEQARRSRGDRSCPCGWLRHRHMGPRAAERLPPPAQ